MNHPEPDDLTEPFKDFVRNCTVIELATIINDARMCADKKTFDFAQSIMRERLIEAQKEKGQG